MFLLRWKDTMTTAILKFRGLVHCHHVGKHDSSQTDMVLENSWEFYIRISRQQKEKVTLSLAWVSEILKPIPTDTLLPTRPYLLVVPVPEPMRPFPFNPPPILMLSLTFSGLPCCLYPSVSVLMFTKIPVPSEPPTGHNTNISRKGKRKAYFPFSFFFLFNL